MHVTTGQNSLTNSLAKMCRSRPAFSYFLPPFVKQQWQVTHSNLKGIICITWGNVIKCQVQAYGGEGLRLKQVELPVLQGYPILLPSPYLAGFFCQSLISLPPQHSTDLPIIRCMHFWTLGQFEREANKPLPVCASSPLCIKITSDNGNNGILLCGCSHII